MLIPAKVNHYDDDVVAEPVDLIAAAAREASTRVLRRIDQIRIVNYSPGRHRDPGVLVAQRSSA